MSADYQTAAALLIAAGDNTPPVFEQIANYVLSSQQGRVTPHYVEILHDNRIATYGRTFLSLGVSDPINLEKVGTIALRAAPGIPVQPLPPPLPPAPPPPSWRVLTVSVPNGGTYSHGETTIYDELAINTVAPYRIDIRQTQHLKRIRLDTLTRTGSFEIDGSWLLVSLNAALQELLVPNYVTNNHNFYVTANPLLTSLSLPSYTGTADFVIAGNPLLSSLSAPMIATTWTLWVAGVGLTSLSLPSLQFVADTVMIYGNPELISIDLSGLLNVIGHGNLFQITGNPNLKTINLSSWQPILYQFMDFTGNALSQLTVDAILASCVAQTGFVSGTLDLTGGTNDPPSNGTGYHNVLVLRGRGITVLHNPLIPE